MLSDNWANIMFTTKKICGQVAIIRRLLLWGRNYVLRLRISRKIGSDLMSRFDSNQMDMPNPRIVHIETRSQCNSKCAFCAAAVQFKSRPDIHMSYELFEKILDDLKEIEFCGRLSLYSNNEPLLDPRLSDFIKLARKKLPKAFIEIKTNGIKLNFEKCNELFDCGLDFLYVNDYVFERPLAHRKNILQLIGQLESIRLKKEGSDLDWVNKINIDLRDGNAVLDSRAGTAPNRKDTEIKSGWICLRPFEMLVVDPRGTVGLCSEDVLFKEPMGNLRDFSIKEIWGGEEYFLVRQKLLNGDRACKTTCAQCDYHGASEDFVAELLPGA